MILKNNVYKIKIFGLFKRHSKCRSVGGLEIHDFKEYLILQCHSEYYELDISPIILFSERKIFSIKKIENIKSYLIDKKRNNYLVREPIESELKRYEKYVYINKKEFKSDDEILANQCIVIDCATLSILMLNEDNFKKNNDHTNSLMSKLSEAENIAISKEAESIKIITEAEPRRRTL